MAVNKPNLLPLLRRLHEGGTPNQILASFVELLPTCVPGAWVRLQTKPGSPNHAAVSLQVSASEEWSLEPIEGRWAVSVEDLPWYASAVQILQSHLEKTLAVSSPLDRSSFLDHVEALRQSEARFRAMVENFPAGAVMISGEEVTVNRAMTAITGYTSTQVQRLSDLFRLLFGDEAPEVKRMWDLDRRDGFHQPRELWIRRSDGVRRLVQFYAYGWMEDGIRKDVWLVNDVTDRERAIQTLRENESRYRLLTENMKDVVWYLDLKSQRYLYVSPSVIRLRGFSAAEVLAQTFEQSLTPSSYKFVMTEIARLLPLVDPERPETCNAVMELEMPCKDGRTIWTEVTSAAMFNEQGQVDRIVGVTRDISERRRVAEERAKLEEQIREAQKLESLGVLAGGIAHDFNNLLMAIMGNLELINGCLPEDSVIRRYVQSAEKASQRATELCGQMLAYSGRGPMTRQPMKLSAFIEEIRPMLEVAVSRKATLSFDLGADLPLIEADQTQVQQVLMNLVTNASEALLDQSGEIRIRTWTEECTCQKLMQGVLKEQMTEGRYVGLSVTDTGCGMDETLLKRMFEPFFSTKFPGRGLGLPAVLGIVRSHGGTIFVDSRPGAGTTVTILFPASRKTEIADKPGNHRWRGSGTILLVDDEPSVREVSCLLLGKLGFQVQTAAEGGEAVTLLEACKTEQFPVCVILDVTMPGMDGIEAHRRIKKRWPTLPIVISSGYQAKDCLSRFQEPAPAGFLKKPYTLSQLETLLRGILG